MEIATSRRRNSVRQRKRFKVTVGQITSYTVDVSDGGFCVELLHVLPPGTPVNGTIQVKGVVHPFEGRVAWARQGEPRVGLRGRMGVVFILADVAGLLL